jgi:hypothetical protein
MENATDQDLVKVPDEVYNIDYKVNGDDAVIPLAELERLIAERNQYGSDILKASEHITKLLKTLSIIGKDGQFQEPSMGKIVSEITKLFLSKSAGPFAHILELRPMLEFYSKLQKP